MDFLALTQTCAPDIEPSTMAAIVKVESGYNPFAIGINNGRPLTRQPATLAEAVTTAKWLMQNNYNIDIGLAQINVSNKKMTGLSISQLFDPCTNLSLASAILKENFTSASRTQRSQQSALRAALSAYNTGNFVSGYANGYVQRIIASALPSPARHIYGIQSVQQTMDTNGGKNEQRQKTSPKINNKNNSWNVYSQQHSNEVIY